MDASFPLLEHEIEKDSVSADNKIDISVDFFMIGYCSMQKYTKNYSFKCTVEKIVEIEKIAEDNIKKFIDETKNFNYEILPYKFISSSSEIDGCKYCSFRKVCYRDGFKFRNVEKGGKK